MSGGARSDAVTGPCACVTRRSLEQALILPALILGALATAATARAADRYLSAAADSGGPIRIERAKGLPIVLEADSGQVGFDAIAVAKDGRSVGWLALYANCCTSYSIPLKLVIYTQGRRRTFEGTGLPIWRWRFSDEGTRVAFEQETVHGGIGIHYELREVASGRLVEKYEPPAQPPDGSPAPTAEKVPAWVADLDAGKE